jgi:opacity protein-like surface antigen
MCRRIVQTTIPSSVLVGERFANALQLTRLRPARQNSQTSAVVRDRTSILSIQPLKPLLMSTRTNRRYAAIALLAAMLALFARGNAAAQAVEPPTSTSREPIGGQGLGIVGAQWPMTVESFEATGLDSRPIEFGGGVQVTNLWRELFAQVTATATSDTGQRVFVDEDLAVFPLGIPLTVKATYIDVSAGWKLRFRQPRTHDVVPYVAGGVGWVRYRESSPFAEAGDDVDESSVSYHVQGGVEVGITKWFGVSADFRYRRVPDLVGIGGVSAAFGEDDFGGFNAAVGLRVLFPGKPAGRTPDSRDEPSSPVPVPVPGAIERSSESNSAVTIAQAPVYLRMDPSLEPLRTLEAGTSVKVLAELDTWVRIEFYDRLLGPRIGFIERKHLRLPKH